jgi:hypothetical protein
VPDYRIAQNFIVFIAREPNGMPDFFLDNGFGFRIFQITDKQQ